MDIKISLEIGLSPALEGFLAKFLNPARIEADEHRVTETVGDKIFVLTEQRADAALEAAEVPQDEAPKRTRRTKAQMEADYRGQSGQAIDASPQSGSLGVKGDDGSAETSTNLADALDAAEADEGAATKDQLRAATSAAMSRVPGCAPKLQAAWVAEFGAEQKSSGTIDPVNYARAIEIANTLT